MQPIMNPLLKGVALALLLSVGSWSPAVTAAADDKKATGETSKPTKTELRRIEREGVIVEFDARPSSKSNSEVLVSSDWADITFRITDKATGEPIVGRYPAAWMDLSKAWNAKGEKPMSCDERVVTYLQGIVGIRPMIDLNAHFLMVLNADPSISVIDPAVGITGITNLFTQVNLSAAGADWAKTSNQKRIFVSMPLTKSVAMVDTEAFKVIGEVKAGESPNRVELQSDERYLWVGNNAREAEQSGVTVIDTSEFMIKAFIPTGKGHHEIAFNEGDKHAFVSNRNEGTVSVIDVQKLEKVKDITTGKIPISLAYSSLSNAVYVADGKTGQVAVIDADSLKIRTRIDTKPGLGPMRFSQDGRWGVVVNPFENMIYVIDASKDQIAHAVTIGNKPYQVSFTRSFAYIRSLGTAQVALLPLSQFDEKEKPTPTYVGAGQNPPGAAAQLTIADAIVPSVKEAASYIVNQAEGTIHYYMEGMAAPMGAFRNYGHQARAIETVDRSLGERAPGVYVGQVKIPIEGTYDIAFMMDTPRFLHCFSAEVQPNPDIDESTAKLSIEFNVPKKIVPVGESAKVRFRLVNPRTGKHVNDVEDMTVLYYRSDGRNRRIVPAKIAEEGWYEAEVTIHSLASYYVFVGSKSQLIKYTDLPYVTLMGIEKDAESKKVKAGAR